METKGSIKNTHMQVKVQIAFNISIDTLLLQATFLTRSSPSKHKYKDYVILCCTHDFLLAICTYYTLFCDTLEHALANPGQSWQPRSSRQYDMTLPRATLSHFSQSKRENRIRRVRSSPSSLPLSILPFCVSERKKSLGCLDLSLRPSALVARSPYSLPVRSATSRLLTALENKNTQ